MIIWGLLIFLKLVHGSEDICKLMCPSSLSFKEKLDPSLAPSDIVVFTGGDSWERRQSGYAKISADSVQVFAEHHGYKLVFIDDLSYNFHLMYRGYQYAPQWHKVFSMPALRHKYPDVKYYVWIDDDIFVPYPQTDMLNHYINLMNSNPTWEMLFGNEGKDYILNSGLFIMRNTEFTEWAYKRAMDIGLERNGRLARCFGHEQEAFIEARKRNFVEKKIRVITHRDGPYNFNTFVRKVEWDTPEMVAKKGDAFVHFLGSKAKLARMIEWLEYIDEWRLYTSDCQYPIQL